VVSITELDGGAYILNFLNPRDNEYGQSGYISTSATAAEFAFQVNWYYEAKFGASANVVREDFDGNGVLTNDTNAAVTRNYTITLDRLIWGTTATTILVAKMSTFSEFEIYLPEDVQVSNPPLHGSWRVRCLNSLGGYSYSHEIPVGADAATIKWKIERGCVYMDDKIIV